MHFTIQQQDLDHGLAIVKRAIPGRTSRPILTNICLTTEDERVRLFATDEEMGIVCCIPATIYEKGTTAVPARLLCDFVGNLQSGPVDFRVKAGEHGAHAIAVRSQRSCANICGFDAAEYPSIPGADGAKPPLQVEAALLKDMIGTVIDAASDDIQWPVFTGFLVQVSNGEITLVGSDRQRLAVRKMTLAGDAAVWKDILIPASTLAELARILPAQGRVEMAVTGLGSQVLFRTDDPASLLAAARRELS